jgi:energy-coupling factor transporter transmembrane protein EcfT
VETKIPSFLSERTGSAVVVSGAGRVRSSVIAKGAEHAASVLRAGFIQWETSSGSGFLQIIDARVKVLFLLLFVVIVSIKNAILPEGVIAVFLLGLAAVSRLNIANHYRKIFLLTFIFGILLALPSACNIVTPGELVLPVWHFDKSHTIGPFIVPATIGITAEGLRRIVIFSLRVMNSLSITLLILATTPFMEFIRALKVLRVPDIFLLTVTLTYKYILVFTTTVYDLHLAKMSRLTDVERDSDARMWVAGRMAFIYRKSQQRCEEVFRAMVARGMSGSVKLRLMPPLTRRDWLAAAGTIISAILILWV